MTISRLFQGCAITLLLFTACINDRAEGVLIVHEEEHHHPIFEQSGIRILEVSAFSGDSTLYHLHKNNIAYVCLQGSRLRLDSLEGPSKTLNLPTGWTGMDTTHARLPMSHRFTNEGEKDFLLFAVEFFDGMKDKSYDWFWEEFALSSEESQFLIPGNTILFWDEAIVQSALSSGEHIQDSFLILKKADTLSFKVTEPGVSTVYALRW